MISQRIMIIAFLILLTLAVIAAYVSKSSDTSGASQRTVRIGNTDINVDVRDTAMSRAQGLSGRPTLESGHGMLFIFDKPGEYGFWMKDMNFAIDILWIQDGKVVGISENLAPEPEKNILTLTVHRPPQPVQHVLEILAGAAKQYGFAVGDSVDIR